MEWLPVFVSGPYFDIIVESLKFIRANKGVQVNAFVIMPTHSHLVLWPNEGVNLSDVMRDFKRHTSKMLSAQLEKDRQCVFLRSFAKESPGRAGAEYRVWQEGFTKRHSIRQILRDRRLNTCTTTPFARGL